MASRVLQRKVRRELRQSAGTLLTVIAIIAVGTGSLVGLLSAHRTLTSSQAAYYRQCRFADFWIDVKKAPLPAVEPLRLIAGVANLETRVAFDVILDLPDEPRPITGRLLSVPEGRLDRCLNAIVLEQGTGFSALRAEEAILSDPFARAHGLRPGDRIGVILNRKRDSLLIVGTAISPEYVYMVRGGGDLLPDPRHFGVLYVKDRYAREVLGFKDACNQIIGTVQPEAEPHLESLLETMERSLDPYGVLATTPRTRQASHRFLSDEIKGLGVSATILPSIFLVVAALALNIVMSRLIERQRTVIGTLKALGRTDREVLRHYLTYGVVVGLAGGAAGILLGTGLSTGMVELYKEFFQFPSFELRVAPDLLLIGMSVSVLFAVVGTARGALAVLRLQPAEAMRPRPPERGGAIFLERWPRLWRSLGFRTHLALRNMVRHRTRTLTGVFSCAISTAIVFTALMLYDGMDFLVDFQFERVSRSDVDIGLRDEASRAALLEARDLPGVDRAEPVLGMVCRLRHGRLERRIAVTGLSSDHRLTTPVQADLRPIVIPAEGLVLSRKLAEILDTDVGDQLELTPVRGRRQPVGTFVASISETYMGLECYADNRYLSRIVDEGLAVNSVQLAVEPKGKPRLFRAIKELPNAQSIAVRADSRYNFESTLQRTSNFSIGLLVLFSGVIAFGTTLNAAQIEIGDRLREIATYRVLGYHPREVAGILLRQNLLVFALGLLLGVPVSYAMSAGIVRAYDSELYRMPLVFRPATVFQTLAVVSAFVLSAQVFVYRQVGRLDWLEGVKVKE